MDDKSLKFKIGDSLTSKYLSPCRTFGLKRKNTSKLEIQKKTKPENEPSLVRESVNSGESSPTLLREVLASQPNRVPGCNEIVCVETSSNLNNFNPLLLNKTPSSLKPINTPQRLIEIDGQIAKDRKISAESDDQKTLESKIVDQIKRINKKVSSLEKLKHEEIYYKKHNLNELKCSTDKWLATFKRIAIALHSELQARGRVCTILDVLNDHSVPPDRVGFNTENLEFE